MRLIKELHKALWAPTPPERGRYARWLFQAGRITQRLFDDVYEGRLNLYAMSLVYTTLLSIVPVLAVSFSVLKGFGVHNQLEPTLLAFLAPLGEKGAEVTHQMIAFVDNIRVGVLGALGLGLLIYTVISLMQKVEEAFNFIWNTRSVRTLSRRFSDYLSVLLVGPVLIFTALGITGSALNTDLMLWLAAHEPAKTFFGFATQVVPFLLIVGAFAFIYRLIPYTRVKVGSAFVGALVAGLLWEVAGMVFASFIAASTRYTAIYSSFAIGILAIIWVYLAWLILLVGCRIAFYHQHPEHLWLHGSKGSTMAPRQVEALALGTMIQIGQHFKNGAGGTSIHDLVGATGATQSMLERILGGLEAGRLIVVVDSAAEPAYLPAAPLTAITAVDIYNAVRGEARVTATKTSVDQVVDSVAGDFEAAMEKTLGQQTLDELVSRAESKPGVVASAGEKTESS